MAIQKLIDSFFSVSLMYLHVNDAVWKNEELLGQAYQHSRYSHLAAV